MGCPEKQKLSYCYGCLLPLGAGIRGWVCGGRERGGAHCHHSLVRAWLACLSSCGHATNVRFSLSALQLSRALVHPQTCFLQPSLTWALTGKAVRRSSSLEKQYCAADGWPATTWSEVTCRAHMLALPFLRNSRNPR